MFDRALVRLLIVLSIFAAAPLASAQEGGPAETVEMGEPEGAENDAIKADGAVGATLAVGENATEKDADQETNAAFGEGVDGSGSETSPAGFMPEEAAFAVMPKSDLHPASPMKVLPAIEDLYVNLTEEGLVFNDDRLVCEYLMGDAHREEEFPGMVMVQFDVSDLEIREDEVAVLLLKAESIEKAEGVMAGVAMVPITSEWSESSSPTTLALNLLSAIFIISNADDLDFSQIGVNFGDDDVLAFDVSEHLKAAEGGRISFLLVAVSDADYRVSFKSRETGEGPSLLIGPYPTVSPS